MASAERGPVQWLLYYLAMDLPRSAREQVVAIKRKFELTDTECRWLRRSAQFGVTRDSAELVRERWVPAAVWVHSVVLRTFGDTGIRLAGLPGGSGRLINRMFLGPWRWRRHGGVR